MSVYVLDDLPGLAGAEVARSDWRFVTQADIDAFGHLTEDTQWIHMDAQRAAAGPFGQPIAHGYFTLALIGGFWSQDFDVADAKVKLNYGMDRVRFVSPVPVNSRVRLRSRLVEVAEIEHGYRLHVDQVIERKGSSRPALVARCLYDFRSS